MTAAAPEGPQRFFIGPASNVRSPTVHLQRYGLASSQIPLFITGLTLHKLTKLTF
jgi:hypothetical protein